jgi:hypothetical protein
MACKLLVLWGLLEIVVAASGPPDTAQLSFLVVGDWGGQTDAPYTTPAEVALAKVMGERAAEINSQFTLALGDNFYDKGVSTVDDPRFKETYEVSFCMHAASAIEISHIL